MTACSAALGLPVHAIIVVGHGGVVVAVVMTVAVVVTLVMAMAVVVALMVIVRAAVHMHAAVQSQSSAGCLHDITE